jgi:hypothetical protein
VDDDECRENADIPLRLTNGVIVGDVLFGLRPNAGQYFGVDAKTGKTLWVSPGRQALTPRSRRRAISSSSPRRRRSRGGAQQPDAFEQVEIRSPTADVGEAALSGSYFRQD